MSEPTLPALIRGRYEPLEVLGAGGQGRVLKALDTQHDRIVALKVREGTTAPDRAALLAEARVLLSVRPHPNLPLVRDDFFEDDTYFLVMDYIEGRELAHVLRERGSPGLAFDEVLGYAEQIAEALEHLHGHAPAVIHGDVKPRNLILAPDGRVLLVDFGIARMAGAPGVPMGTPGYVAPEVRLGDRPTRRSDVYGLAATVLCLLQGSPPRAGPIDLATVPEHMREGVEWTVRRALSTNPEPRPESARAFVRQLRHRDEDLPRGTVTFVSSDIEDSPRLWEADHDDVRASVGLYRRLAARCVQHWGGHLVHGGGDEEVLGAFARASDAAACALDLQRACTAQEWPGGAPVRVRIAVHSGDADWRDGMYTGAGPEWAVRLRTTAWGGQVVTSDDTASLLADALPNGTRLLDLGRMQFADATGARHVVQLCHADLPAEFPRPRSVVAPRHNLPVRPTKFVGREAEVGELRALVRLRRLVTLSGPGGIGKTRLAVQVAAGLHEEFRDGAWLIELAKVRDAGDVVSLAASTLGVRQTPDRDVAESLRAHLRDRDMLLVLDNCEHVHDTASRLAQDVLESSGSVRILATSREALAAEGESVYPVAALPSPPPEEADSAGAASFAGVELFVNRASLADSRFELTERNAVHVARICRSLDGLPLAIELAAARVRALSVEDIAARLDRSLALLTQGTPSVPRHKTLRAAIDWSHELLDETERTLFRRLSVFAGGWTLDAAEAVCADEGLDDIDVVSAVGSLASKSLVVTHRDVEPSRYSMLETVRQFAAERLAESGEHEPSTRRFVRWAARYARDARAKLEGPEQAEGLRSVGEELGNVRAAVRQGMGVDPGAALEIIVALARFWRARGHFDEARSALAEALDRAPDVAPELRGRALALSGWLARARGDFAAAAEAHEADLAHSRAAGDEEGVRRAVRDDGIVLLHAGKLSDARARFEESHRLAIDASHTRDEAESLYWLGVAAWQQGDTEQARERFEASLRLRGPHEDPGAGAGLLNALGILAAQDHDQERARELYAQSLAITRSLADREGEMSVLVNLGALHTEAGELDDAEAALDRAHHLARELGARAAEAVCLRNLGVAAHRRATYARARSLYEQSLRVYRETGGRAGEAPTLAALGQVAHAQGRYDDARRLFEESVAIFEELGNAAGRAPVLRDLALLVLVHGDHDDACGALDRAVEAARDGDRDDEMLAGALRALRVGDAGACAKELRGCADAFASADNLTARGLTLLSLCELDGAGLASAGAQAFRECFDVHAQLHHPHGVAVGLTGMFESIADDGTLARLLGACDAMLSSSDAVLSPRLHERLTHAESRARTSLGDERFDGLRAQGRGMTIADVVRTL